MGYARSQFRDFESYPKIVVGLDEDDIQLTLKQCNLSFIAHELVPGVNSIEDNSKVVYKIVDHEKLYKLKMMILAWEQNLFWLVLDQQLQLWGLMKNLFFILC